MDTLFLRSRLSLLLAAVTASGCASIPADWGRDEVATLVAERGIELPIPDDPRTDALLDELLAAPLTVDASVRIALQRNPALRATYARLGLAAADVYEAGRLSNPVLFAASLDSDQAGAVDQVTFGLAQSFADLLLLRSRSRIARGEFERVQQIVGSEVFELSADVERAFYDVAGAHQLVQMRKTIVEATEASAQLARRYFDAGNLNRLDLALEQAAASDARLALLEGEKEATRARNRLQRLLDLPQSADWCIRDGLPTPPAEEMPLQKLYALADRSRLDLAAARREVEIAADALGVTRTWRWLGVLEVGLERKRETDGERVSGPTLSIELPLWNQNAGRVTRAEAELMLSEAQLNELVLNIVNDVHLAHADAGQARARIAELERSLLPLREDIVRRAQEQVNYMLMGVFDLLRFRQQEYDAYAAYLLAVRDYWLARSDLERAVGAPLPGGARDPSSMIDAGALTMPESHIGPANHGGYSMPSGREANSGREADPMPTPPAEPGADRVGHTGHDIRSKTIESDRAPEATAAGRGCASGDRR